MAGEGLQAVFQDFARRVRDYWDRVQLEVISEDILRMALASSSEVESAAQALIDAQTARRQARQDCIESGRHFAKALERAGKDPMGLLRLVQCLECGGDPPTALAVWQKARRQLEGALAGEKAPAHVTLTQVAALLKEDKRAFRERILTGESFPEPVVAGQGTQPRLFDYHQVRQWLIQSDPTLAARLPDRFVVVQRLLAGTSAPG